MKNINLHKRMIIPVMIVVISTMVAAPFMSVISSNAEAASLDELRAETAKLEKQIKDNNDQAEQLKQEGDSLKTKIGELDLQIQRATTQIALTQAKIAALELELVQAQTELDRQKGLLKSSMRALYKRGDASTVELIVGSENFGQFIDEQEYLERLKVGVQDSTNKVIALKQQIEAKHNEQIELKKQQEAQRALISKAKTEQTALLAATQGQESKYRSVSAQLQEQQKKLINEIVARSQVLSGVGTGSYPWAGYREGDWNHQQSCYYGDDRDKWGCFRQCVHYAAWRLYSAGKTPPQYYGDATNWDNAAKAEGIPTGKEAKVGAVAVWEGAQGHVAYVEEVMGDKVRISEYNAVPAYGGKYSQRIIYASDPATYIYFK